VVVDGPGAALLVERLKGDEQLREEAGEDPPQDWPRILQPWEAIVEEAARDVVGILGERVARLVAPVEADVLVPHEAEGLDDRPSLRIHPLSIAEGLGDVIVRRRSARVEHRGGDGSALPGDEDETAPVSAEGDHAESDVEIQG